ncbi:hypothetical protein Tco_0497077 [Tanacetum coccineum]
MVQFLEHVILAEVALHVENHAGGALIELFQSLIGISPKTPMEIPTIFFGLAGYYRRFIEGFLKMLNLNDGSLLRKENKFDWGDKGREAFQLNTAEERSCVLYWVAVDEEGSTYKSAIFLPIRENDPLGQVGKVVPCYAIVRQDHGIPAINHLVIRVGDSHLISGDNHFRKL